jgi:hypothetical protein
MHQQPASDFVIDYSYEGTFARILPRVNLKPSDEAVAHKLKYGIVQVMIRMVPDNGKIIKRSFITSADNRIKLMKTGYDQIEWTAFYGISLWEGRYSGSGTTAQEALRALKRSIKKARKHHEEALIAILKFS